MVMAYRYTAIAIMSTQQHVKKRWDLLLFQPEVKMFRGELFLKLDIHKFQGHSDHQDYASLHQMVMPLPFNTYAKYVKH